MDNEEKIINDNDNSEKAPKNKKNNNNSSKKRVIIIIIVAVIIAAIIGGGVYCAVTEQSPVTAVKSAFTANEKEICAKWQSQTNPGLNAYVFYDDGTYDNYFSNFNFDGVYTIDRNKLTLKNPTTSKDLVYKFTIHGDVLTLTLIEEDGEKPDEETITKFDKVDELSMKSLSDMLGELTTSTTQANA